MGTSGYRQAIVPGACPVCGGRVVLRWAWPSASSPGFANAWCTGGHGAGRWHAGSYEECPVEEMASPSDAVARLIGGRE